jgi:hypothetical protein
VTAVGRSPGQVEALGLRARSSMTHPLARQILLGLERLFRVRMRQGADLP